MENASALEQMHRDQALAAIQSYALEADPAFDGVHCIEEDCGDAIPGARLALGKIRCITCQSAREKRRA